MTPKHTPGPWKSDEGLKIAIIWGPGRFPLDRAIAQTENTDWPNENHLANARLISCAPEMLAVLKQCAEALAKNSGGLVPKEITAIIAKAETK